MASRKIEEKFNEQKQAMIWVTHSRRIKLTWIQAIISVIIFYSNDSICQTKEFWELNFERTVQDDSIIFKSTSPEHMNYFTQEVTSTTYYFGDILLGNLDELAYSPLRITQIVKIHHQTNSGSYSVYLDENILFEYEIQENFIQGIGKCYYLCPECPVVSIGLFLNGKLHGPLLIFNPEGTVMEIQEYKTGKYKRHQYHYLAKAKKTLRDGNRKSKRNYKLR